MNLFRRQVTLGKKEELLLLNERHFYWDDTYFYFGIDRLPIDTPTKKEYIQVTFDTDPIIDPFFGFGITAQPFNSTVNLPFNADVSVYVDSTYVPSIQLNSGPWSKQIFSKTYLHF